MVRRPFFVDKQLTSVDLDDELDLVNVQNMLRESLISSPVTGQATLLDRRPAFKQLFESLAHQLIDGIALDVEGLMDVLTLKGNVGESSGDAATALDRLVKDSVSTAPYCAFDSDVGSQALPEGRKQVALLSIWRRIFIRDEYVENLHLRGYPV